MLQHIKELERAGEWAQIRALAPSLPVGLTGDELARAYLGTSKAFELTATSGADYRTALAHARAGVAAAEHGGLLYTWLVARVAAYCADLGDHAGALEAAELFEESYPANPGAAPMEPYALFAKGRALAGRRNFAGAIATFRRALTGDGEIFERIRLHLAWTLAEAGQVRQAFETLPVTLEYLPPAYLSAAMAVVHAAAGDWVSARAHARMALRSRIEHPFPLHDTVQAAELALIIHRANAALAGRQAWFCFHTAAILAGWNAGLMFNLLPTLQPEGGVYVDEAANPCGPAGHHRTGLRGAVG